jgi:hypothetical protein
MPHSSIIHFGGSFTVFSGPRDYSGFLPIPVSEEKLKLLRMPSTPQKLLSELSKGKSKIAYPFFANSFTLSPIGKTNHPNSHFNADFSLLLRNEKSIEQVSGSSFQNLARSTGRGSSWAIIENQNQTEIEAKYISTTPETVEYISPSKKKIWTATTSLSSSRHEVQLKWPPIKTLPFEGKIERDIYSVSPSPGFELTHSGAIEFSLSPSAVEKRGPINFWGSYVNARYTREPPRIGQAFVNHNEGAYRGLINQIDERTSSFAAHVYDATTGVRVNFEGRLLHDAELLHNMNVLERAVERQNLTVRDMSYILGAEFLSKFGPAIKIAKVAVPVITLAVAYGAWQKYQQARAQDGDRIGPLARRAIKNGAIDVADAAVSPDVTGYSRDALKYYGDKGITALEKRNIFAA